MFGRMGARGGFGGLGSLGGAGKSFDPAASALFAAMTTQPTAARKALINNAIVALKASGAWALMDVLYVLAAADSQAARLNWISPSTFTASLVNSPLFTVDRGFTGDGAAAYLNSNYTPSTAGGHLTQDSAHYSGWSLTAIGAASSSQRLLGNAASTSGRSVITPWFAGNTVNALINDITGTAVSNSSSLGQFIANRSGASARQVYMNGSSLGSDTTASLALPTTAVSFGRDVSNFASLQISVGSIGASLSSGQASSLYSALQTYLHAIGAV